MSRSGPIPPTPPATMFPTIPTPPRHVPQNHAPPPKQVLHSAVIFEDIWNNLINLQDTTQESDVIIFGASTVLPLEMRF